MGGSSLPSSPRRFANHGLVYLSEIETLEDLNELSTKQIKDLLAMNRVNFKGCVEKEELLKILRRLWKQEQKNKENIETMDDDSLCKICMDSPVGNHCRISPNLNLPVICILRLTAWCWNADTCAPAPTAANRWQSAPSAGSTSSGEISSSSWYCNVM